MYRRYCRYAKNEGLQRIVNKRFFEKYIQKNFPKSVVDNSIDITEWVNEFKVRAVPASASANKEEAVLVQQEQEAAAREQEVEAAAEKIVSSAIADSLAEVAPKAEAE